MRRYLITAAVVLVLHTVATILFRAYSGLLVDMGGLFVRNTDLASIWDREVAGFTLAAAALLFAAIVMTYLRGICARLPEGATSRHSRGGQQN